MEHAFKLDDMGVPHFRKLPYSVYIYIYIHIVLMIYTNIISLKFKNKALALARRGICWPRLKVNHGRLEALQPDGISGTRNISGTHWIWCSMALWDAGPSFSGQFPVDSTQNLHLSVIRQYQNNISIHFVLFPQGDLWHFPFFTWIWPSVVFLAG